MNVIARLRSFACGKLAQSKLPSKEMRLRIFSMRRRVARMVLRKSRFNILYRHKQGITSNSQRGGTDDYLLKVPTP
ncbi:hypothetical protein QQP08_020689 [Theobroma cacao]|nr:hypothetical protein QQP08_020689 [Theobroma cacao]